MKVSLISGGFSKAYWRVPAVPRGISAAWKQSGMLNQKVHALCRRESAHQCQTTGSPVPCTIYGFGGLLRPCQPLWCQALPNLRQGGGEYLCGPCWGLSPPDPSQGSADCLSSAIDLHFPLAGRREGDGGMDANLQVMVVNFAFTRLSTASTAGHSCRGRRKV